MVLYDSQKQPDNFNKNFLRKQITLPTGLIQIFCKTILHCLGIVKSIIYPYDDIKRNF